MVRHHRKPSRAATVSENEIALDAEVQRLRKLLAATRARLSEKQSRDARDIIYTDEEVSEIILKMERICRRTVKAQLRPGMSCDACGGVSWYQFEQAMFAEVRTSWAMTGADPMPFPREPDEQPRPGYDDEPGRLDFRCIGN